jgi:cytochrome c-type biogenesis protein CcmH
VPPPDKQKTQRIAAPDKWPEVCENLLMILFLSIASAIAALTFIVLALGIKRSITSQSTSSNERLAVFKDRKREIEADRDANRISADDANQAIDDLSIQLEREAQDLVSGNAATYELEKKNSPSWPWVTVLLVAGVGVGLTAYNYLGAPELTEPSFRAEFEKTQKGEAAQNSTEAKTPPTAEQIEQAIDDFKKLAEQKPNDFTVWGSLGRAYRMAGKPNDAVAAYSKAKALGLNSPDFLVDYAEAIAASKRGDFSGLPVEMLAQALAQNPDLPKGIALMGAAQYRLGNFAQAKIYLQKTLAALPPGSEQAKAVQGAIDQIAQAGSTTNEQKVVISATVALTKEVIEKLKTTSLEQAALFIALRAPERPMPIAARKVDWASVAQQLQKGESVSIELDNSHLLAGGSFDDKQELILAARLSMQGNATRSASDMTGTTEAFTLSKTKSISIRINQVSP